MFRNNFRNNFLFGVILSVLFFSPVFLRGAEEEGYVYDAKGKRNPFIPLVTQSGMIVKFDEEADNAVSLEGIIYDKNGMSVAVVNGQVLKIGDKVSGYQVLQIEENKVVFIKNGQTMDVQLKKEEQ